jgi:hypothetical protein
MSLIKSFSKALTVTATAEAVTATVLGAGELKLQAGPTSQDIFIGGSNVSSTNGFKLSAGQSMTFQRDTEAISLNNLYFVGAFTGGQNCTVVVTYIAR